MVCGKNSEVEDELNEAIPEEGGAEAKAAKPAKSKGIAKAARKPRGPCRPYRKFSPEKLEKLIETTQTRCDTLDAKHRMCSVRLKAYKAEASMREQDVD